MRVTIKDIARETGFSVTTISLVLNNKADKIPAKTKCIILEAAERMKYRPNQLAVGLVKKQSKTIGLIIADIRNVYFSNLARGVEDECRKNGWNLILCNTNDKCERDKEYIQILASKGVDGILFVMAADSKERSVIENINLMNKFNMPYLFLDRRMEGVTCPFISVDNIKGGYLATRHLIELGHKKIACVTGPFNLSDSKERLQGYKNAIAEAGITFDQKLIFPGSYKWEDGIASVEHLSGQEYTAIFTFNDMSAYAVCKTLKQKQVSIPADISVVGYDNIFFSEIAEIPLTTINQPIYEVGLCAVRELLNCIKNKCQMKEDIIMEPTLVIRESTAKAKQKENDLY